ncbi:MAG TPA: hypothetical protein VMV90_08360 [Rectinemataceae bacterium]|nr:hypothetical protein [Rectinemataceae bacterium]
MSAAGLDASRPVIAVDHLLVPTDEGVALVHNLTDGRLERVSAAAAALLGLLSDFRPLEEHFASIPEAAADFLGEEILRAAFAELEAKGLVYGADRLRSELAASRSAFPARLPLRIEAASWLTRSRYGSLERSMASFIRDFAEAGRSPLLRVFDDSPDPRERVSCRGRLAALARASGFTIEYAGHEEKRVYADRLAAASGVERRVIDFALFGRPGLDAPTIGANHNAALLFSRGRPYLHCDDDILCEPAPSPNAEPGFVVSERDHLGGFRFFGSEAELAAAVTTEPVDVLARFEELLGREAGELIGVAGPESRVRLKALSPAFVHRLAHAELRPAIVSVGCYGDSGMRNPSIWEVVPTPDLLALFPDAASFASALRSRALWRRSTTAGLTRNPSFMSMNAALAPELGLPPHFPCFHNEDGLFAASYLKLNPGGAIGHLPFALRHDSANPPFYGEGDEAYVPGLDDILVALVEELRPSPGWMSLGGEARFAELGAHIRAAVGEGRKRAMEFVHGGIIDAYAGRIEMLERRAEDDSLPEYLRSGMLDAVALRRRLIAGKRFIPNELVRRPDWADIVVSLGRDYAALLEAWPELMKKAASLG